MVIWIKQGVMGDLQPVAQKGFGKVVRYYEARNYKNFYVTSLRESNHSHGSFHYIGLAFDFRSQGLPGSEIKTLLGHHWDIVDYGEFIHAEYDQKII